MTENICEFCGDNRKSLRSLRSHKVLCKNNPNRIENPASGKPAWNRGLTNETSNVIADGSKKSSEALKRLHEEGKINVTGCFAWTLEERSKAAKEQGFGGYRENAGRSKKFRVVDSFGKSTTLQSSYELQCAEILDKLNIKWVRPKALKYDNGKNYFADFYLTNYNIWLDPKNPYKAKLDEEKINKVKEQNNINLYVILNEELTEDYIKGLCR